MSRADRLLARMRRTKFGFKPDDLKSVYLAKGFSCEHGKSHDLLQHRKYQWLITTVRRSDPIKPAYIETLLELVDAVDRLEHHK